MNLIECFVQEIKLMNWRINNMKTVMDAVNELQQRINELENK